MPEMREAHQSPSAYDSLDRHLAQGLDMAQACVPMGMLLAWAVNLQLLAPAVEQEHERLVLRIRYGEVPGSELFVACGGVLSREFFTPAGQAFLDRHYDAYLDAFAELFDTPPADNQSNYALVARWLTKHYMHKPATPGLTTRLRNWWRQR